ncbi:MAG: gamma-glutamyltransferase [Desulfurococcaceae archaeon]
MPIKTAYGKIGVTSDHPLATKIGIEILESGGNAFDAAIAVSAVLAVVQPHLGGLGGDAFLLGVMGDDIVAIASSGESPKGFKVDRYLEEKPTRGPLTVTVPGLVHLWGYIYEKYSSMPLESLIKPAIKLAYNGFHAGWSLATASRVYEAELSRYKWARYFRGINQGDLVVNKELYTALRLIATRGWDEFYYGELAEVVVNELQEQSVDIGLDDLMEHESSAVKPLKLNVDNKTLYELPPNTQGASTLQLISALYELELYRYRFDDPERIFAWSEPINNVYLFRDIYLGDPDYMKIDINYYINYREVERALHSVTTKPGTFDINRGDTTFFAVSDGETLIGFIQSLFYPFGSGLVAHGFPLQNRGVGFAKTKGLPNSPAPGKKPLHTLSILLVDDDRSKYIIGCVGGDYRPQLHLRVYENIFVYNMHPSKAVDVPRFIYTKPYNGQQVVVESPFPVKTHETIKTEVVDYYNGPGYVHVLFLCKGVAGLTNDPRSEGASIAI